MPTSNVTSDHSEHVIGNSGGGGSLAASAAMTNGNVVGNTANTLISTYFQISSFGFFYNYRSFLGFDISGLSGTVTGVTLTLTRNVSTTTPILHFLASEASDAVGTSDYLDGLVGASSYPFTSDVTEFTDSGINMNADGGGAGDTITVTLNAAAVTHANAVIGSGKFKIAIVNQYDLNNTYGSSGIGDVFAVQGAYFRSTQHATGGDHPVLNVTTEAAAAPAPPSGITIKNGSLTLKGGTLTIK